MLFTKYFKLTFLFLLLAEIFSYFGYLLPNFNQIAFWVIVGLTLILSLLKLNYGLYILLAELFIGSKGYLFSFELRGIVISIRLALFLVVLGVWIYQISSKFKVHPVKKSEVSIGVQSSPRKEIRDFYRGSKLTQISGTTERPIESQEARDSIVPHLLEKGEGLQNDNKKKDLFQACPERKRRDNISSRLSLLKWYFLLFFFIALGILNGFFKGNSFDNIFFDANGWLYFALLGVFLSVISSQEKIEQIFQVFLASLLGLSLKTLFLLFVFTHDPYLVAIPTFYQWVRLTGVGEITIFDNFSRIFIQSQLYILIGFFVLLGMLIFTKLRKVGVKNRDFLYLFLLTILTVATLLISFSRSFWIAAVVGIAVLYFIIAWRRWKDVLKLTIILLTVGIVGFGLVFGITNLPVFGASGNFRASMVEERSRFPTEEAAVASRWALLNPLTQKIIKHPLLGSGFGTTVTFKTQDPRFLEKYPSGSRTTYAFEWGYLDIWLKIGLVGLGIYLWLVGMMLREGMRRLKNQKSKIKNQNDPAEQDLASRDNVKLCAYSTVGATHLYGGNQVALRNSKLEVDQKLGLIMGLSLGLIVLLVTNIFSPYLNHPLGIGYLMLTSAIFMKLKVLSHD